MSIAPCVGNCLHRQGGMCTPGGAGPRRFTKPRLRHFTSPGEPCTWPDGPMPTLRAALEMGVTWGETTAAFEALGGNPRVPYLRDVLDRLGPPSGPTVVITKGSAAGGTEIRIPGTFTRLDDPDGNTIAYGFEPDPPEPDRDVPT